MSWRRFFRRSQWDQERSRELLAHLELEMDENIARGMSADEARTAAYKKLGNPTLVREEIYGMNSIGWFEAIRHDVRFALRVLRKSPSFTLVALLSLGLGIGANAAIFQLVNAVRLRTLPVPHPNEIVELRIDTHGTGRTGSFTGGRSMMTYPLLDQIRRANLPIGPTFAWAGGGGDLADGGESRPARLLWVSGNLFGVAGVRQAAGRLITPDDDVRGCGTPAAVLNYAFWQSQYGGDPSIVGKTIHISGVTFVATGVTEPKFFGFNVGRSFDIAVPLCSEPLLRERSALDRPDSWWLSIMARLPSGITEDAANRTVAAASAPIFAATLPPAYREKDATNYKAFTLTAATVGNGVSPLRAEYAQPLWLLLGIAGIVLLIACGNLANLMLARASVRQQEMAVRLAIGASRRRLIKQLMVESLMLAVGGGIAGMLVASVLSKGLVGFLNAPGAPPVFVDLGFDWTVLGFTAALAGLTCMLFGLAPALRATKQSPSSVMRASGRGLTDGRERFSARRLLVIGQFALSLVLVCGALLFAGTLANLIAVNPGFDPNGVTEVDLDFRRAGIPADEIMRFKADYVQKIAAIPGVQSASEAFIMPLSGSGWNETIVIDGKEHRVNPNLTAVSPDFFKTMKMPMIAGRTFNDRDTLTAPKVAVVTESFGRTYFNTPSTIGREFHFAAEPGRPVSIYTVIGVVPDIKYQELSETAGPVIFLPVSQDDRPDSNVSVVYRATSDVAPAISALARSIHQRNLVQFSNVAEAIRSSLVREQLMATLSVFFGAIAALLAAVGLYGVTSYLAERRRMEIGIRVALGASRGQVVTMFLRESGWLVGVGLVAGLGLSWFAARAAASLLFGMTPKDPAPFIIATTTLAIVALFAAFIPARRASREAPTTALRG